MVEVLSDTKQVFNGRAYYLCGYYFQRDGVRLHRKVWESYYGPIPKGFHVHHKDDNRANNDISNLELMDGSGHMSLHKSTPEAVEKSRQNIEIARIAAAKWRKTPEARRLQSIWSKEGWKKVQPKQRTCEQCGKAFMTRSSGRARFCSNNCKSAFRRASGVDNEARTCRICGKEFITNKYGSDQCCSRACAGKASASKRRGVPQSKRCIQHGSGAVS